MNFNVRTIADTPKPLQEMTVDAIETGTLNKKAAMELAEQLLRAAEQLTWVVDLESISEQCGVAADGLMRRIPLEGK